MEALVWVAFFDFCKGDLGASKRYSEILKLLEASESLKRSQRSPLIDFREDFGFVVAYILGAVFLGNWFLLVLTSR